MKNVLYIEDDIVDQMAFKRMMKVHSADCTYTIVSSVSEFKKLQNVNNFDIVITDYNLGDGEATDIIKSIPDKHIIVVSGSTNEQFTDTERIKFVTKPLNFEKLSATCESIDEQKATSNAGNYKHINLTYLQSLGSNDHHFMTEMLQLASTELQQNLEDLQHAINLEDYKEIKFHAHRFKSRSRILGLNLEKQADWIEFNSNSSHIEAIKIHLAELRSSCIHAFEDIELAKKEFSNSNA